MVEPGQIPEEPRIAILTTRSLSSFKTLILALQDEVTQASAAVSTSAKFKLWAGTLGAHRPSGSRSLEYRLRDASFIRDHVISLLKDLQGSIDQGKSRSTSIIQRANLHQRRWSPERIYQRYKMKDTIPMMKS